jgi:hypothetical protein
MRIEGSNRTGQAGTGRAAQTRGDNSLFRLDDAAAPPRTAPAAQPAAVGGIEALLALQSIEDPLQSRKRIVKRANALLDELEQLKADILAGHLGEGHLNRLTALLTQAREEDDPSLQPLIDDIELRARVELAKRGRYL